MPKPKNKEELVTLSKKNYSRLIELIDSFSEVELHKTFPEGHLNRNIRDVLGHLHHWHLMFSDWYKVGMAGNKPHMPAKGYTWKTTPELNKAIRQKYSTTELNKIQDMLKHSHNSVHNLINLHSQEELFQKKRYKWTGSTSLGAYLIAATSSHYAWAYKLIKKCLVRTPKKSKNQ